MIDFNNKGFFKLKQNDEYAERVRSLLLDGEQVIDAYKSMRDGVVFTTQRIIAVNVQGLTGSKKDFTSAVQEHRRLFGGNVRHLRSRLGTRNLFLVAGPGEVRIHRQDVDRGNIQAHIEARVLNQRAGIGRASVSPENAGSTPLH